MPLLDQSLCLSLEGTQIFGPRISFNVSRARSSKKQINKCHWVKWYTVPGDPLKCVELVFWILTSKVVKIEPSYWDWVEKKQNFIRIFLIPIIWKSDHWHWSLHHGLIIKSGQNAEKSRILLFSNLFRDLDLLSENVHIITKWMA